MSQDSEETFESLLKRHLKDGGATANVSTFCPDENVVSAYLEGTLAEHFRTDFEMHVSSCVRCQKELALLVKSQALVPVSSATSRPLRSAQRGWLATLQVGWAWLSNVGPKPVLAVLAVMLISGYVGVELFQRERQQSATEVARTIPPDRRATEEQKGEYPIEEVQNGPAEAKPAVVAGANEKPKENQEEHLAKAKKRAGAEASPAPPVAVLSKDAGQEKLLRDTYSPTAVERSEADKTLQLGSTSESLARLPAAPSPEPASTVARRDGAAGKAPERQLAASKGNRVTTSTAPEDQPDVTQRLRAVPDEDQASIDAKAKEHSVKKQAYADDLSANRATAGKTKREATVNSRAEGAGQSTDEEQRQLRVAGKIFELRNNVWTDVSIKEKDAGRIDVTLFKDSSDYRQQVKPLSAYSSVLSRDEDCLVEHREKIYMVRSSR